MMIGGGQPSKYARQQMNLSADALLVRGGSAWTDIPGFVPDSDFNCAVSAGLAIVVNRAITSATITVNLIVTDKSGQEQYYRVMKNGSSISTFNTAALAGNSTQTMTSTYTGNLAAGDVIKLQGKTDGASGDLTNAGTTLSIQ